MDPALSQKVDYFDLSKVPIGGLKYEVRFFDC